MMPPSPYPGAERSRSWIKRGFDLSVAVLVLPFLAGLMIAVACLHRLYAPGPLFFRQIRHGLRGRTFVCYKFRTMLVGADTAVHETHVKRLMGSRAPMLKLEAAGDPRLMRGAWILRSSGLDELPQIINVLKGEMSLVGPRPCVSVEYDHYPSDAMARFCVVPGLTGLWQVSGKNRTTFAEMIQLDEDYVRRQSLSLDLLILLRTLPAIVTLLRDSAVQRGFARSSVAERTSTRIPPQKSVDV